MAENVKDLHRFLERGCREVTRRKERGSSPVWNTPEGCSKSCLGWISVSSLRSNYLLQTVISLRSHRPQKQLQGRKRCLLFRKDFLVFGFRMATLTQLLVHKENYQEKRRTRQQKHRATVPNFKAICIKYQFPPFSRFSVTISRV